MTLHCFDHADEFVTLADDDDLQWFAQELHEALVVKVRGVLGSDEGDLEEITLLNNLSQRMSHVISERPLNDHQP